MRTLQYTRLFVACLLSAGVVYFSLATIEAVYATTYYAKVTGYAFASISASGVMLQQNHFANHPPTNNVRQPSYQRLVGGLAMGHTNYDGKSSYTANCKQCCLYAQSLLSLRQRRSFLHPRCELGRYIFR